jgi:hypothetical protein
MSLLVPPLFQLKGINGRGRPLRWNSVKSQNFLPIIPPSLKRYEQKSPTATDLRLREKGMDNFALRCFNTLAHDREVSGVQVVSILLQQPTHYTINYNFVRVNLSWLRWYVRDIIRTSSLGDNNNNGASDPMAEEPCMYEPGNTAPASIFDDYNASRISHFL